LRFSIHEYASQKATARIQILVNLAHGPVSGQIYIIVASRDLSLDCKLAECPVNRSHTRKTSLPG
jgi:hypothetical protein